MRSLAVTIALIAASVQPHPALAQRTDCNATELPKRLPPPSSILDSARAIADLSAYPAPAEGMVFTVMYDETDPTPHTWPLEVVDSQAVVPFARTLRPHKAQGTWAVRVRIVEGAVPAVTLERSTYCPPTLRDASSPFPVRTEIQIRPGDHLPPTTRPNRVDIEARISETGQVISAKLVASTGIEDVDVDILRRWQLRHFYPALVDGMPVPGWYRTDGKSFQPSLSAQESATCAFDTAAHTEKTAVNLALAPAWGPTQRVQARDDYLLAAQAIAQYFRPPPQVRLPFWARTVGFYRDESGRHSVGMGLRGYLRFRLDPVGRLADSAISVDFASSDLAEALMTAIRRADSALAFAPPSDAVVHDHGIIRLRILAPPDTQRSISLLTLVVPVIVVDSTPEAIAFPALSYPNELREAGLSGRVLVGVVVLENGRIDPNSLDLVRAQYREFAVEALHGIEGARFRPARVGSCTVPMAVTIPVDFKVRNRAN